MDILLVDDHPVILEIMQAVLRRALGPGAVHVERDLDSALKRARRAKRIDLAVLDLALPGCAGIQALKRFREQFPRIPVVVISAIDDGDVICAAIEAGARGYIPKTCSVGVIQSALRIVAAGSVYVPPQVLGHEPRAGEAEPRSLPELGLSGRQLEVLRHIAKGLHNRQIAIALDISENTVKRHAHEVFRALNVRTRTEALVAAVRNGLRLE